MAIEHSDDRDVARAAPPPKGTAETPERLADTLISAIGVAGATSWLDPCAGSGPLIAAALRTGVPQTAILAIDLEWRLPKLERLGVKSLLSTDFLAWARGTKLRFDRVIANPPFVRLSALDDSLFSQAAEAGLNGIEVPRSANYWMAFLLTGLRLLKPKGSIGFILPAAWEYADYASEVREMCAVSFGELDIHRVNRPMFDEVADGCVMLIGRRFADPPSRPPRVFEHDTLEALAESVMTAADGSASAGHMRQTPEGLPKDHLRFGQIAQISIGAVTGDARYFLLNEARRVELRLPRSAVRPILSRARQIVCSEIDELVWRKLMSDGERVWLFYPSGSDVADPAVCSYLDLSEEDGGCRRGASHVRKRNPWYRVQIPSPFDGFVTGMSQTTTWIMLNQMEGLTASNTLYGVRFVQSRNVDEWAAWCLSLLASSTVVSRERLIRQYPQGLRKLEPCDIGNLAVRQPKTTVDARSLYREATALMMRGYSDDARSLVDDWLEIPGVR